jgi:ATP-dependent RNA helicase DDX31/DBP7
LCDRLLDLGFDKDIRAIRSILNERASGDLLRHGMLLSATINDNIRALANTTLNEPQFISEAAYLDSKRAAGRDGDHLSAPSQIVQSYVVVPCKQRLVTLAAIIRWNAELPYVHIYIDVGLGWSGLDLFGLGWLVFRILLY